MLLPRELIYIEKNNFDLLIEDDFINHVFNILIDLEDKEDMQLIEANVNIESIYVAFFNMVFYLASEARHKSNPSLRIKEYVSYIEETSIQQGLSKDLCREIALSLLYYLYENLPIHDTRFLERLKAHITSEYLFDRIGECKTELQSNGDSYFACYGALPRYTLEYLKKCAWNEITHYYDMNSIRYILEYTTSYKCERKNIADSIMSAIEEESIELMNGSGYIDYCRNCITEILEEIGGWPGELDYKGLVRHTALSQLTVQEVNVTESMSNHEKIEIPSYVERNTEIPFIIAQGKVTSVLVVLETMHKAGWIRKADGSKYHSRDEMINDVARFLFNTEEIKDIKQKLNSAKNRTYDGKKKYLDELMKYIVEDKLNNKE